MRNLQEESKLKQEEALKRAQERLEEVGIDVFRIEAETPSSDTPAYKVAIKNHEEKQASERYVEQMLELKKTREAQEGGNKIQWLILAVLVIVPIATTIAMITLAEGAELP